MRKLRLVLIVMLAALMDLGSPVMPEALEGLEEFEEAAHERRRLVRPPALTPAPGPATPTPTVQPVRRPTTVRWSAAHAIARPTPKAPPRLLEPSSAPDDH
jgi:hypothetical protein